MKSNGMKARNRNGRYTRLLHLFGLITTVITKCGCENIGENLTSLSKIGDSKTGNGVDWVRNDEVNQLLRDWNEKKIDLEEFLQRHQDTFVKVLRHVREKDLRNDGEFHGEEEEKEGVDRDSMNDDPNLFNLSATDYADNLSPNINEVFKIWHQLLNYEMLGQNWMQDLMPRSQNIDECISFDPCQLNEDCLNVYGSYACQCKHGFRDIDPSDLVECIDIDECEVPNSCKMYQVCINRIGSYDCQCSHGYEDVDPSNVINCQASSILECSPERIKLRITFDSLRTFIPVKNAIARNPDVNFELSFKPQQNSTVESNCTIKSSTANTSAVYLFEIFPPFEDCGTTRTNFLGTQRIVYENVIWWTELIPGLPFLKIPYHMFGVKCEFPTNLDQNRIKVETSIHDTKYTEDIQGQPNIEIKFWNSPPNSPSKSLVEIPASYEIGEVLYVTVQLNNPELFGNDSKLLLNKCYVSSLDGINHSKYLLIENGCNALLSVFSHGVLENGRSSISSFFFQMFRFQPFGGSLFINCDVTVCRNNCEPRCLQRRKRSNGKHPRWNNGSIDASETLPREIPNRAPNEPGENEEVPATSSLREIVIPLLLIASNVILLVLLGLLSYVIARTLSIRRRSKRSKIDHDGIVAEALGRRSFTPPASHRPHEDETISNCPVWGSNPGTEELSIYHTFCNDKNCIFMKSKKSGKHFPVKKSKKAWTEVKQMYDLSTLTCPTPFNSPPHSPTTPGRTAVSIGTSPIRVIDDSRNMPSTSTDNVTES